MRLVGFYGCERSPIWDHEVIPLSPQKKTHEVSCRF